MKIIAVIGDIGSGKSYISKNFGFPVFNADQEVSKLYKKDKSIFKKFKKILSKYIKTFPINKNEISKSILANHSNLNKIIKIVHPAIRKKLNIFLKKNKQKKIVVLDIPLLLENKINKKNYTLVFISSNKSEALKRLKKRKNFNEKLIKKFRSIQLPLAYKKKKSKFVIKNNFTKQSIKKDIVKILEKVY
jgi:dephospho-CoA kinase